MLPDVESAETAPALEKAEPRQSQSLAGMRFTTFVSRNIFRRKIRSTLTITGMAIAVTAVVALVGLSDGFNRTMLQQYVKRGISLIVTRKDSLAILNTVMPEKVVHDIQAMDGVEATCPGLLSVNPIEELGSDPIAVQGWDAGNYMFHEVDMVSGRTLSAEDHGKKSIIVGRQLSDLKGVKLGDKLTISDEKYQVVGVYTSIADLENGMVIMLLDDAQRAFGQKDKITGCTVKLKDNSEKNVQAVSDRIETQIAEANNLKGKLRAKPPDAFVQTNGQMKVFRLFAWVVSLITLVVSGIGVLNTMFMSVFERTREIGILRAIGWRPQRVMHMILLESVGLSIGGGIMGTLAGLGIIALVGFFPTLSGAAHAAISWDIVIKGFGIAMIVGVAGAAYPAYRGSRLLPTEALRHE
jgi:putative ABC transport system permease protein